MKSMHKFTFTSAQYDNQFNLVTIEMPRSFFMDNIRYKLKNGQHSIREVELTSPSGKSMVLSIEGEFGNGIRYKNNDVNLKLVRV